ncbi:hypothetical protein EJB05_46981, partial [Eragrostis curvula]
MEGLNLCSIERASGSDPSAAAELKIPSSSKTIPEKVAEPEEGAVEDLGDGLGDDNSEGRPPTPPSEAPKTSPEEPEEVDATTATADDSTEPKTTAETGKNVLSSDASPLAANSPMEGGQGAEEENSQRLNREPSPVQELTQPMEVDHQIPEEKLWQPQPKLKLMSDLDEDIRKQKQSESINQTKFHYHHGGLLSTDSLLNAEDGEKLGRQKETMLLNLRPHLDKQLALEEQIAALQAESREKDALIQRLQSAAGSSGACILPLDHERLKSRIRTLEDQYAKASQLLTERDEQLKSRQTELEVAQRQKESHSAKEEHFYQELNKAIEAETAATKIAREKDQSLKVALERVSNLRTKFSRKKTQLKEKEQLIAGLEAALKTREDELSACTVEKSMLQRDHKKELGKVRDSLLELELSAAEVIDYVYSSVELKDQKSSSELLEMMPAELKKHCRFVTNMCSSAVLAKVKSHYPGLEEP